jgi:hypothetical protein
MPDKNVFAINDTYADSDSPTTNYDGIWTGMMVRKKATDAYCRMFLEFNAASIPSGSIILTAALKCYVAAIGVSTFTIDIHEIAGLWSESTLTWVFQPAVADLLGSYTSAGATGWKTIISDAAFIALVQEWVDEFYAGGLKTQYGLRFKAQSELPPIADRYDNITDKENGGTTFGPKIVIHYNRAPYKTDQLSPSGGQALSSLNPTLSGRFNDRDNEDTCNMIQIKIYESDGTTIKYDTGQVAPDNSPVADLGTWQYEIPSAASLTWGTVYKYKVRVRDQHNASNSWSDYSNLQSFICLNPPSISIQTPTDGNTIYNSGPLITWSYYQAQGNLQMFYRVRMATSADFTNDTIYDSGIIYSSAVSHQCLIGTLPSDGTYFVRVDIEDEFGAAAYDEHTVGFIYSSITGPSAVILTLYEEDAKVKAQWERASAHVDSYWELYVRNYGDTEWELVQTEEESTMRSCWDYTCHKGTLEYSMVYVNEDGHRSNPEECKAVIEVTFKNWWFSSNDDPTKCLELWGVSSAPFSKPDMKMVSFPLGRNTALVESYDFAKGLDMQLTMTFRSEDSLTAQEYYQALDDVRDYTSGSIFLKSNMGHRWRVSISNINIEFVESMIEIYIVSCRVVEV